MYPSASLRNPVSLQSVGAKASEAGELRDINCTSYSQCVDAAVRAGWQGFSCTKCPLRGQDKGPRAEDYLRQPTGEECADRSARRPRTLR